jgi:hypothetical protein
MKCQIDEHLDGGSNLLVIREFNRDGLSFCDNGHPVGCHDSRFLRKFAPSHTPTVHDADARANRLVGWMSQTIKDANEHKFAITFLTDIVAKKARLKVWDHKVSFVSLVQDVGHG